MATAATYSPTGEKRGTVDLPVSILAEQVHEHAIWEAVKSYLANQRQGTHKTKTRHEVSGQKSKMYRQKGTGRARAGSATSGTRVGGGRIHGPRPREHGYSVPAQVRRLALRSALAARAAKAAVHIVEDLQLEAPRTRTVAVLVAGMGLSGRRVLLVNDKADRNLVRSCRNLQGMDVTHVGELHAYQVMQAQDVVFTQSGLAALGEVLAR